MRGLLSSRPSIESLESRRLASVTTWSSNSLSNISENYFTTVQWGDNGDPWGVEQADSGISNDTETYQYTNWNDGDYSEGFDSGDRSIATSFNSSNNGVAALTLDGQSPTTFTVGTSLSFSSVTIRAQVRGMGLLMAFSSIDIKFFHNGALVQEVTPTSSVTADTRASTTNHPAESGMTVTPTATNINGVSVSANVRLASTPGTNPGQTDIAGQIFLS